MTLFHDKYAAPFTSLLLGKQRRKVNDGGLSFTCLCVVVLSLSSEIPIANWFPWYRLNPRPFDIALLLFFLARIVERKTHNRLSPQTNVLIKPWAVCCLSLVIAQLTSYFWIPSEYYKYAVFWSAKYAISILFLWQAFKVPITNERLITLLRCVIVTGFLTSVIVLSQWFDLLPPVSRQLSDGLYVQDQFGIISGFLESHFQVATQSSLCISIALAILSGKSRIWKSFFLVTILINIFAVIACGARVGIIMVLVIFCLSYLFGSTRRAGIRMSVSIVPLILALGLCISLFGDLNELITSSRQYERLQIMLHSSQSLTRDEYEATNPLYRSITPFKQLFVLLDYDPLGLVTRGLGYGVVDDLMGELQHIHSVILWPIQYGGIIPLGAFLWLLFLSEKRFHAGSSENSDLFLRKITIAMRAFFWAWIIAGFSGQIFWFYEGSGNLTNYLLLMLGLILQINANGVNHKHNSEAFLERPSYRLIAHTK
jgi:hypothetical protein